MKKIKKQLFVFIIILFSFLLQNFIVVNDGLAQTMLEKQEGFKKGGGEIPGAFGEGTGEPKDVRVIMVDILKVLFTFLGLIMVGLLMYGGFLWMTAGGNDDQISQAKNYLKNATIGVAIILASYGITIFVINSIVASTGG